MKQKIKNPSVEAICIIIKIQLHSNTFTTKHSYRALDFTPCTCYNTISPAVGGCDHLSVSNGYLDIACCSLHQRHLSHFVFSC